MIEKASNPSKLSGLKRISHALLVPHKGLRFIGHLVLVLAILMIASDFAETDGRLARQLTLPGANIIPVVPWIATALYILIAFVTQKAAKQWVRIGGVLTAYLLAGICATYPNWIFEKYAQEIRIDSFLNREEDFLPRNEIADFERTFNTPTVQRSASYKGICLVVPRSKYSQSMINYLKDRKRPTPTKQARQ